MKKTITGNKAVSKHNEYMIDKTLVKRIQSAKSTINNKNDSFTQRIQS